MEFGHFDKHFVKNTRKGGPAGKFFFFLDTLKTTSSMEKITQRWIQSGLFFQNQGTFFDFQKRAGETSPLMELYDKFVDRFQDIISKVKNPAASKAKV